MQHYLCLAFMHRELEPLPWRPVDLVQKIPLAHCAQGDSNSQSFTWAFAPTSIGSAAFQ